MRPRVAVAPEDGAPEEQQQIPSRVPAGAAASLRRTKPLLAAASKTDTAAAAALAGYTLHPTHTCCHK